MFEMSSVLAPFDHKYVYGAVPPLTTASIEPEELPKQSTSTGFKITDNGAKGSETSIDINSVQPKESITVNS